MRDDNVYFCMAARGICPCSLPFQTVPRRAGPYKKTKKRDVKEMKEDQLKAVNARIIKERKVKGMGSSVGDMSGEIVSLNKSVSDTNEIMTRLAR